MHVTAAAKDVSPEPVMVIQQSAMVLAASMVLCGNAMADVETTFTQRCAGGWAGCKQC